MHPALPPLTPSLLHFVRHGATDFNLAGLRCGGDVDPPLAEAGHLQAVQLGRQLASSGLRPGCLLTSDLQRTRQTAQILADALGGLPVLVLPGWAERRLGAWNLQPVAATQAALQAGTTPPGGESNAAFTMRIRHAVHGLLPHLPRQPLMVGSKGVARVLGVLTGLPQPVALHNGAMQPFDLAPLLQHVVPEVHA